MSPDMTDRKMPIRTIAAVFGIFTFLAVLILVSVMLGRSPDSSSDEVTSSVITRFDWIEADDLVFEDELARGTEIRWIPFRPRRDQWSELDAEEHWIDPRQIGIEVLEGRIHELIRLALEEVP